MFLPTWHKSKLSVAKVSRPLSWHIIIDKFIAFVSHNFPINLSNDVWTCHFARKVMNYSLKNPSDNSSLQKFNQLNYLNVQ